jgi:hypothetical protein
MTHADMPSIPVTAKRLRSGVWQLTFSEPCPFCGRIHRHGGGTGAEPFMGNGVWFAHCAGSHVPIGGQCQPARDEGGRRRCSVNHGDVYHLYLVQEPVEREAAERITRKAIARAVEA